MERGGEGRERGRQAFGFLTWAGLGCLHSEAESGKLNYNSSHKERVSWLLLPLGSPAQPLPMSWGPLPPPQPATAWPLHLNWSPLLPCLAPSPTHWSAYQHSEGLSFPRRNPRTLVLSPGR